MRRRGTHDLIGGFEAAATDMTFKDVEPVRRDDDDVFFDYVPSSATSLLSNLHQDC